MNNVALDRVRDIRAEKNLHQSDLARRTGYSQSTISYVEKNGRGSHEQAQKFASALGVPIAELSRAGYETLKAPVVRLGEEYVYQTESNVVGAPDRRDVERLNRAVETRREPDESKTLTIRIEPSEALLERLDRVLDVAESFILQRS